MASSSSAATDKSLAGLSIAVKSTTALLQKFEHAIVNPSKDAPRNPSASQSQAPTEPLALLHTSATLAKAQTTKLSLLILNKPFSPTAISTILRDLSTGPLAVMMSAAEVCTPEVWGKTMSAEVKLRVLHVLRELRGLMGNIPLSPAAVDGTDKEDNSLPASRDPLATTGGVWEACDSLADLHDKGVAGLLVQRAQQYRDTLEDAIAELTEWSQASEADSHSDEEDEDSDAADARSNNEEDGFDDLFSSSNALPKGDSVLRSLVEISLKRLALVKMLYSGLIKRRLPHVSLPVSINQSNGSESASASSSHSSALRITRIDQLLESLKAIPEETDELASAFYELDEEDVKTRLEKCLALARNAAESTRTDRNDEEDEFTKWLDKWLVMIDKERIEK
ncbi:MAG: 60S ribosomal protein L13 [Chaenotheca gracillima]|nr:MAG: 60S ribosomal protein L13 [Chaenotheca gracillima]